MSSSAWDKLCVLPQGVAYGNLINVNSNELLLVTSTKCYKFNHLSMKWQQFMKYKLSDVSMQSFCWALAIDQHKNTLYGTAEDGAGKDFIVSIDIESKKIRVYPNVFPKASITWPSMTYAENSLHLVGGTSNSNHLIWNHRTNKIHETELLIILHLVCGFLISDLPLRFRLN